MNKNKKTGLIPKTAFKKGKKHSQWMGGISFEPYGIKFNRILKEQIRKRDNHKCVICYKFGKDVHHIDYNKRNNKQNNLITLCRNCHCKTGFNRDYWFAYFTYLIKK